MDTVQIAKICHQANKALCEANGDKSQADWDSAEDWQTKSAINGVEFVKNNPDAPDSATHDSWMAEKLNDGWKYGTEKNAELKTHPCLVPFDELPKFQQNKDLLFKAICNALF